MRNPVFWSLLTAAILVPFGCGKPAAKSYRAIASKVIEIGPYRLTVASDPEPQQLKTGALAIPIVFTIKGTRQGETIVLSLKPEAFRTLNLANASTLLTDGKPKQHPLFYPLSELPTDPFEIEYVGTIHAEVKETDEITVKDAVHIRTPQDQFEEGELPFGRWDFRSGTVTSKQGLPVKLAPNSDQRYDSDGVFVDVTPWLEKHSCTAFRVHAALPQAKSKILQGYEKSDMPSFLVFPRVLNHELPGTMDLLIRIEVSLKLRRYPVKLKVRIVPVER
jgi:hypothetical protein